MTDEILIEASKCPECKHRILLKISTSRLKVSGSLSGVATVSDIHGLYNKDNPHIRILYVDVNGVVRAQTIIKLIVGLEEAESAKVIQRYSNDKLPKITSRKKPLNPDLRASDD
ncbi:MAG: hypothetical protein ACFFDI_15380 [Promethearchaeota archaeon]